MKRISLLGSTGSIGCQTLEVAARNSDRIKVSALAAGKRNREELLRQIKTFEPELVVVPDEETASYLKKRLSHFSGEIKEGLAALEEAAGLPDVTHVVVAVVGSLGLLPTLKALSLGKIVALANKETLVAGGHLVTQAIHEHGGTLIPVDSEHSAIFQCLVGEDKNHLEKIWLTASGGPFRGFTSEMLKKVTREQVLSHPTWRMGNKITVDSASLMNKGLEVIEAKWLFGVSPDRIRVVVHPQSIIHSMVEFVDGSLIAQMGLPDMRTPIQYAISYPERWSSPPPKLDLTKVGTLTFEDPDSKTFPCLAYAFQAAQKGGTLPAVMNAANEAAVQLFLEDMIPFSDIPEIIHSAMQAHQNKDFPNLEEVLEADRWARKFTVETRSLKSTGLRT